MLNQLGRFELARRVLNHAAVVDITADVLHRPLDSEKAFESALVEYGRLLRIALTRELRQDTIHGFPEPVLPVVDLAHLEVSHVTCTGNTRLIVLPDGFGIIRGWNGSPRDRLLDVLQWGAELPVEAPLFLDEDALRSTGLDIGHCLLRLHGELALYRQGAPTNYYEVLYTEDGVYRDMEYDFGEAGWMHTAPEALKERLAQHRGWIETAIAAVDEADNALAFAEQEASRLNIEKIRIKEEK